MFEITKNNGILYDRILKTLVIDLKISYELKRQKNNTKFQSY